MFVNRDGTPTIITMHKKAVLFFAKDDDLVNWSGPVVIEPKVQPGQDGSRISNWDPDAWVIGNTTYALQGVYPLKTGTEASLMKSTDMKSWEYVGPFMSREMPGVLQSTDNPRQHEDVSCPNFFKIGNKWMLLCISHIRGCRYYLGDWKNEQFVPEFHARMNWSLSEGMKDGDHGGEFFAPESLLAPDGRRVMWAWLFASSNKKYGETWYVAQSLPRELSLPKDGVLRIKPLKELEQLRYNPVCEKDIVVENGATNRLKNVSGDTIEIMATIKQGDTSRYGVRLLCDKDNANGLDLVVEPGAKSIKLGSTIAPFELKRGEDIQLRIFVDRSIVEVFVNDRQAVVKQHAYAPGDVGVCLFSEGGKMEVRELKAWTMAASNPW
jgi:sucrose-6-phosphate hydrolase SacC (GH32 family)